jgi:hypothetical protein
MVGAVAVSPDFFTPPLVLKIQKECININNSSIIFVYNYLYRYSGRSRSKFTAASYTTSSFSFTTTAFNYINISFYNSFEIFYRFIELNKQLPVEC